MTGIWLEDLGLELVGAEPGQGSRAELNWHNADNDGAQQAHAIERMIEYALEQVTSDFPPEYWEMMEDAAAAWSGYPANDVAVILQDVHFVLRHLQPPCTPLAHRIYDVPIRGRDDGNFSLTLASHERAALAQNLQLGISVQMLRDMLLRRAMPRITPNAPYRQTNSNNAATNDE